MVTGPESEPLDGGTRAWRWMRSAASRTAVVVVTALVIASPVAAGCDDDDRPPTPISLKASPLSSGGIMLQWSSRVGHYDIYIRDKLGRPVPEAPDIVGGATNENYHEFYGLESGKEYFFSMRARSEGGREGCISKNISETVHATTDSAEMNQHCSYYARNAMEDVEEMRKLGCELPDSPIIGRWATHEGTQFTYCMGQQRAGLLGDANYSWLRNQDIQACKEVKRAAKCKAYAKSASAAARYNRVFHCGYTGPRWVSFDAHYNWCVSLKADSPLPRREARARAALLQICRKKRAGTQGGGGNNNCPGVPAEWADMLKAHNELRGQYCGSPLTWSCDLAADAKTYAEACKCGHGNPPGIGENLAARSAVPDKYPAGTDRQAFDDTWACEKDLYDFNKPVIVGGFKHNCLPPPAGEGVNGHFTQVVWKSTKEVGCGRARCPIVDKDCNVIKPESYETHWVCRYGPGGNDPDQLAQNVQKPPACTQSFRSNSEPITCSRGMVLIGGSCRCKPGEHWTGRFCRRFGRTSAGTSVAPAPAPAPAASTPTPTCPSDRPVGTYPNCCPSGTVFSDGTCRSGGGASTAQPGGGATSGGTGAVRAAVPSARRRTAAPRARSSATASAVGTVAPPERSLAAAKRPGARATVPSGPTPIAAPPAPSSATASAARAAAVPAPRSQVITGRQAAPEAVRAAVPSARRRTAAPGARSSATASAGRAVAAPAPRSRVAAKRPDARATVPSAPIRTAVPPARSSATANAGRAVAAPAPRSRAAVKRPDARATVPWVPIPTAAPPAPVTRTANAHIRRRHRRHRARRRIPIRAPENARVAVSGGHHTAAVRQALRTGPAVAAGNRVPRRRRARRRPPGRSSTRHRPRDARPSTRPRTARVAYPIRATCMTV